MHGLQIWVALPKTLEQMEPEFFHIEAEGIPAWQHNGIAYKLIAGEAFGRKSAVPVYSPLFMIELKSTTAQTIDIGNELFGEAGLYILEGSIENDGNTYHSRQLLVAKNSQLCQLTMAANTTLYLFGGEPFPEERFIDWNFVATDKATIKLAKEKWITQDFPKIKGDETDFVPYPSIGHRQMRIISTIPLYKTYKSSCSRRNTFPAITAA
jgi:hypothetical protein